MPLSEWLEVGLAVSGLFILLFIGRAFQSARAWEDGAEYEMLGLPMSQGASVPLSRETETQGHGRVRPRHAGKLGIADRVVRFGFCVAFCYLSIAWFGVGSPAMGLAALLVVYLFATLCAGVDPIYSCMHWSTVTPSVPRLEDC